MTVVFETKTIVHDGFNLSFIDWGNLKSPTIVLMHGLQDCARSWDTFAASLAGEYRVIALDSRGHGDSGRPLDRAYGFEEYVSDIGALLDRLHLNDPILVGHSAGGRYVYTYAARNPHKVRALVVVDIDPDSTNVSSASMFDRYLSESDEWPSIAAVVERLRLRQPQSSDLMLLSQAKVMTKPVRDGSSTRIWKRDRSLLECYQRPDLWDVWKSIRCPTVVIRGRQSDLLTHHIAVKMRESLPGSLLAELEGGGHWLYQEHPGAFESAVRWFVDGLDP